MGQSRNTQAGRRRWSHPVRHTCSHIYPSPRTPPHLREARPMLGPKPRQLRPQRPDLLRHLPRDRGGRWSVCWVIDWVGGRRLGVSFGPAEGALGGGAVRSEPPVRIDSSIAWIDRSIDRRGRTGKPGGWPSAAYIHHPLLLPTVPPRLATHLSGLSAAAAEEEHSAADAARSTPSRLTRTSSSVHTSSGARRGGRWAAAMCALELWCVDCCVAAVAACRVGLGGSCCGQGQHTLHDVEQNSSAQRSPTELAQRCPTGARATFPAIGSGRRAPMADVDQRRAGAGVQVGADAERVLGRNCCC